MKTFMLVSAIFMSLVALPATRASQAGTPIEEGDPGRPLGRHPCFQQLIDDLKACDEEFCIGVNCNDELLDACIWGARQAYKYCMEEWASD